MGDLACKNHSALPCSPASTEAAWRNASNPLSHPFPVPAAYLFNAYSWATVPDKDLPGAVTVLLIKLPGRLLILLI